MNSSEPRRPVDEAYTGETGDRRQELEQALLQNRVKALVATTAFAQTPPGPPVGLAADGVAREVLVGRTPAPAQHPSERR